MFDVSAKLQGDRNDDVSELLQSKIYSDRTVLVIFTKSFTPRYVHITYTKQYIDLLALLG